MDELRKIFMNFNSKNSCCNCVLEGANPHYNCVLVIFSPFYLFVFTPKIQNFCRFKFASSFKFVLDFIKNIAQNFVVRKLFLHDNFCCAKQLARLQKALMSRKLQNMKGT